MASLLIVGADHLGQIEEKLSTLGFDEVVHISGRKSRMIKTSIPEHIDAVLVITEYINHNLSKAIKQKAKEQSLPIYFSKRSWCSIQQALFQSGTMN